MGKKEDNKVKEVKNIKIKKGWVVETIIDGAGQHVVAKKKFFQPMMGGFSSGEITYSIFKSNKKKPTDNVNIEEDL